LFGACGARALRLAAAPLAAGGVVCAAPLYSSSSLAAPLATRLEDAPDGSWGAATRGGKKRQRASACAHSTAQRVHDTLAVLTAATSTHETDPTAYYIWTHDHSNQEIPR